MTSLDTLRLSISEKEEDQWISATIRRQVTGGATIQILEAGCGQRWLLDLEGARFHLTGVDLDPAALAIRTDVKKDLDVAIVGDLRTVELAVSTYDAIFCAYVLEHIDGAQHVLQSFVRWLRPNGVLILRIPDPKSVYGFVASRTPHWFHIFYYRWILGKRDAGKPGFAPYRTIYDKSVSREGIHDFCNRYGLTIELEVGDGYWKPGRGVKRKLISLFKLIVYLFSIGSLSHRHTNLLYILRK